MMDINLAIYAEKLKLNFRYVGAEKDDMRMAHVFLERIISSGQKCFQKKRPEDNTYRPFSEALQALDEADKLLVTWGNRGSHSLDLVRSEAEKLINTCEKALNQFVCPSCGKKIWYAATIASSLQCECGTIRWKF